MDIAIIGIGLRFPGSHSPLQFWQTLCNQQECIKNYPSNRWDINHFYDADPHKPGKMINRKGGYLDDITGFDWRAFRLNPQEASLMDPQHRLLLEVSWEALEDAGIPFNSIANTRAGVYVGISWNDYLRLQNSYYDKLNGYTASGNLFAFASNRISYMFNLQGPSISIDTGCSSSFVSIHLACQSLMHKETDMAFAGGVELILSPDSNIICSKTGALSPTEKCRALDAHADGFLRGEGAAILILKRLSDVSPTERVYAVIKSTAQNHNGKNEWIMAPSSSAQEAVIKEAYIKAGINPALTDYVELHGTALQQGDVVETKAIGNVIGLAKGRKSKCAIGSVKTNIGSLGAAAGMASIIKVALALYYEKIPATLNYETPNPNIGLDKLKLKAQTKTYSWPQNARNSFVASVNGTSISGTNTHIILQKFVSAKTKSPKKNLTISKFILLLSARSQDSLNAFAQEYIHFLNDPKITHETLKNICYSANVKRTHHEYRMAISGNNKEDLKKSIKRLLDVKKNSSTDSNSATLKKKHLNSIIVFNNDPVWLRFGEILYNEIDNFKRYVIEIASNLKKSLKHEFIKNGVLIDQGVTDKSIIYGIFLFQQAFIKLCESMNLTNIIWLGDDLGKLAILANNNRKNMKTIIDKVNSYLQDCKNKKTYKKNKNPQKKSSLIDTIIEETQLKFANAKDTHILYLSAKNHNKATHALLYENIILNEYSKSDLFIPFLKMLSAYYEAGHSIDWQCLYSGTVKYVDIPTYNWQREKCWPAWIKLYNNVYEDVDKKINVSDFLDITEKKDDLRNDILAKNERDQLKQLEKIIHDIVIQILDISDKEDINHIPFRELGIDSIMNLSLKDKINKLLNIKLYPSALFDYSNISHLAQYLQSQLSSQSDVLQGQNIHKVEQSKSFFSSEHNSNDDLCSLIKQRTLELTALLEND